MDYNYLTYQISRLQGAVAVLKELGYPEGESTREGLEEVIEQLTEERNSL